MLLLQQQQQQQNNEDDDDDDDDDRIVRRDLSVYHLLAAPRTVSNTYAQSGQDVIVCKSRATHRGLIVCSMSCTTWYGRAAQLSSLTEFTSHLF